jgi:hypothetical protein
MWFVSIGRNVRTNAPTPQNSTDVAIVPSDQAADLARDHAGDLVTAIL